jgi:ATP-dependent DNA ligase
MDDPRAACPCCGSLMRQAWSRRKVLAAAGIGAVGLTALRRRLGPFALPKSRLSAPPWRSTRFGSPLVLSRVHWVEPKLVAEITYLTWTTDNLLRQTV